MSHSAGGARLVSSATLASLVRDCFEGVGLSGEDARTIADALVDANLRGLESHGFQRVPTYMRRVREGLARGTERMRVRAEFGPMCDLDAQHALGPAAATRAVDAAVELAGAHGLGLVALGNSTHFGAAGFYARRAARQGLVAIVTTNGPKNMAPHGAAEPFLGTSALAIAAPLGRHGCIVLDMSASVTARGKVMQAAALGQELEPGLAIDRDGRPTQDAAAALAGSMLPLGGAKGSGLALAICVLSGLLAKGDFDDEMAPMHSAVRRPQNVGQLFLVIDPWRLTEREQATRRVEELVDRLHALRTAEGFERVLHAGERGDALAAERLVSGIPVGEGELRSAADACDESGLADLAERLREIATEPSVRPSSASAR